MSVLGISNSSSNPYLQYLESLSTGGTGGTVSNDSSGAPQTTSTTSDSSTASGTNSTTASLVQQLEAAIQNALNGVSSNQNASPQDVLNSVEQAVKSTLQSNGIDPTQLSQTGHHHHHHGGGQSSSASTVLSAISSGTGPDPSTAGDGSTTSQTPTLDAALGQLNVDPQQFRNDLLSAISGAQGGAPDLSKVLGGFPPGQAINALA